MPIFQWLRGRPRETPLGRLERDVSQFLRFLDSQRRHGPIEAFVTVKDQWGVARWPM
jgi:hypothetical protein